MFPLPPLCLPSGFPGHGKLNKHLPRYGDLILGKIKNLRLDLARDQDGAGPVPEPWKPAHVQSQRDVRFQPPLWTYIAREATTFLVAPTWPELGLGV